MTAETTLSEAPLPNLPALKCLSDLAGVRPTILIDTREQAPLPFARLASERGTLQSGDYSFRGGEALFAVERKTVGDLVSSCVGENRERFFRELHRLRGYRFKRLLIVGTREGIEAGEYRSGVTPQAVLATLSAIEARFDVPVVFAPSPEDGGRSHGQRRCLTRCRTMPCAAAPLQTSRMSGNGIRGRLLPASCATTDKWRTG